MGLPAFPPFGMLQPTGQTFVMIVRFLVKGAAAKDEILSSPRVDSKKLQIRARSLENNAGYFCLALDSVDCLSSLRHPHSLCSLR